MTGRSFKRYPMVMNHPHFQPATMRRLENATPGMSGEVWGADIQGTPSKFPPVTVHNEEQEDYHAAQGYVPSAGDEEQFNVATHNLSPAGYTFQEYPKWINDGTEAGATVHNPEQEAAVLDKMGQAMPQPTTFGQVAEQAEQLAGLPTAEEIAAFRAWKAQQELEASKPARKPRAPRQSYKQRTQGVPADSAGDGV